MSGSKVFAYVANAESREILVLQLDAQSGTITPIQRAAVSGKVMPMAVSPDRRFLYAALRSIPYSVASFAIDQLNGRLTHLADAALPESMVYLSADRTGRFLLASSIPTSREKPRACVISVSPIGSHGFVQPPQQVIRTEPKMHCILPDPSNRYVFATSCDSGLVLRQIFDPATGMISPNPLPPLRVKPGAGPRHFVFHPNNRFMYLLNETDASLYTFGYDVATGGLTELQISSTLPADFRGDHANAADLHFTPDGKYLYASERATNTLAGFRVDQSTGMLADVGNFSTEDRPRGFNIDPLGKYLLAVGELSHSMTSYAIDAETGRLTPLHRCPMGKDPNWVEIVRLA